jgi:hypothetical protein
MNIGEPLLKSPVNPFSGLVDVVEDPSEGHETERRIQTLFNAWLRYYFTGSPVGMIVGDPVTFPAARIIWNQDDYPDAPDSGVIHWALISSSERSCQVREGYRGYHGEIDWSVFLRVSSQKAVAPVPSAPRSSRAPEFACRRLASYLKFLLQGPEVRRLAASGISKLRITRGPVVVPGSSEFLRQLIVRHKYFYEVKMV